MPSSEQSAGGPCKLQVEVHALQGGHLGTIAVQEGITSVQGVMRQCRNLLKAAEGASLSIVQPSSSSSSADAGPSNQQHRTTTDAQDAFEHLLNHTITWATVPPDTIAVLKETGCVKLVFAAAAAAAAPATAPAAAAATPAAGNAAKALIQADVKSLFHKSKQDGCKLFLRHNGDLYHTKNAKPDSGVWVPGFILAAGYVVKQLAIHYGPTPPTGITMSFIHSQIARVATDHNSAVPKLSHAFMKAFREEGDGWEDEFSNYVGASSPQPLFPAQYAQLYTLGQEGWGATAIVKDLTGNKGTSNKKRERSRSDDGAAGAAVEAAQALVKPAAKRKKQKKTAAAGAS